MNMKKLFSIAMIAALLSTTTQLAYATSTDGALKYAVTDNYIIENRTAAYVNAGSRILIDREYFLANTSDSTSGLKIALTSTYDNISGTNEFCDDYFTITKRTYIRGADLVQAVFFGVFKGDETPALYDGQYLIVELKDNHFLSDLNSPNLQINEFVVKAKKDSGAPITANTFQRNDTFTFQGSQYPFFVTTSSASFGDDNGSEDYTKGTQFKNDTLNIVDLGDDPYDDFYASESDLYVYGRAYNGEEIYINLKYLSDYDLLQYNFYSEDVRFYQVGIEGAAATWRLELQVPQEYYVYEMRGDNLYDTTLEWSDEVYAFTGTIRDTINYVVSATPLESKLATEDLTTDTVPDSTTSGQGSLNPNTGN